MAAELPTNYHANRLAYMIAKPGGLQATIASPNVKPNQTVLPPDHGQGVNAPSSFHYTFGKHS